MKKHIIKSFLLFIVSLLIVVGCSNTDKEIVEKSIDSTFIADLEKAIQKRWDYNDDVLNEKIKVADDVEYYEQLLSYEKELYKYADEDFNDPRLKAIAVDYINGLKSQEEAIQYVNVDFTRYDKLWYEGYDARSVALLTLVDEYGLKLNDEQFRELKTNAQLGAPTPIGTYFKNSLFKYILPLFLQDNGRKKLINKLYCTLIILLYEKRAKKMTQQSHHVSNKQLVSGELI